MTLDEMQDRSFVVLGWLVLIGAPFLVGMLCTMFLRRRISLVLAIALPWLVFLVLNTYTSQTSPDRELLQGTFMFFQLTLGPLSAVSGAVGHWFAARVARRKVP
jgi:hypothetical protein